MNYFEVSPLRIVRSGVDVLTYASETALKPGQIVHIPIGKQTSLGVVMRQTPAPKFETKPIVDIVTETALPNSLIALAEWLSHYYRTPLATTWQTILPRGLDKKRRSKPPKSPLLSSRRTNNLLNDDQTKVVEKILSTNPSTLLLQGVTGSGKTNVYKAVAKENLSQGRSVILLVPEISLTSQLVGEFATDFPTAIVTHSQMTEAERHLAWQAALEAAEPQIIIGPRSALFMPVPNLGVIIVDEAHEPSYKQDQSPRYSAVRAATVLGQHADATVILGTATPTVVDRYLVEKLNKPLLRLDKRARHNASTASVELIDMKQRSSFKRHRFLSDRLLTSIENNLDHGHQTLIFHNRRGSASTTLCEECGWTAECPRCFVPLTLHADRFEISCHICGHHAKAPTNCPTCRAVNIVHKGIGTKLVESELRRLFPKARIARFDSDSAPHETVDRHYEALYRGEIDIAIGTQVVAKGLDLPKLRTVGVIQADGGLMLPDFAAAERAFQLLAQVVGRVGRDSNDTNVVVQSYQPTHPVIQAGITQDYETFYQSALAERERGHFPPFTYLLKLTNVYKSEKAAVTAAQKLASELRQNITNDVKLFGPTPSFYERQRDTWRWQIILKSPKREHLIDALRFVPPTHWQADLDPHSLL